MSASDFAGAPFRDSTLTPAARAADLLERMTIDEKVAQLGGIWPRAVVKGGRFDEAMAGEALAHGTGHISRIAASTVMDPRETAELANAIQRYLIERTRLGIPAIVHEESCAGYTAKGATCFPQAIGLASTWNPELIRTMADAIRRQMRAAGAHHSLAPVLDIARDHRWGRVEETYGEDPYLAARLGVAYVQGLQGPSLAEGIVATGKHFIGYGASEGGLNWAPAHIGPRELREVYAVPFEAAIREAGLASMMNSYAEIDGVPCGGSAAVLRDLLRDELGFAGTVVADYFTVATLLTYHRVANSPEEAAMRALEAGIDIELPDAVMYRALPQAVVAGRIDESVIDEAVLRVLRQKFELGLFERPYVDADAALAVFDTPTDRALAREIAQQSIVLLKNDGVLPLSPATKRIAVIGPAADSARLLQGDYHYPTHLEPLYGPIRDGSLPPEAMENVATLPALAPTQGEETRIDLAEHFVPHVTLLAGIRGAAADATVTHAQGCYILGDDTSGFDAAVAAAREADVAIVAVGGRSGLVDGCTTGEASDRADLALPGVQQQLVEAVVATGTPVVVVLVGGQPLAIPWIAEHVPAIVQAWIPGEEGGNAVADVLFGAVSPSGRLPVSMARDVGQMPIFYNHKPSGGRSQWRTNYTDLPATPLFAFGHGLSYTTLAYSNLRVAAEASIDAPLAIALDVTNTGDRAGDEVVQLYVHDRVASATRPVQQLAGFARVALDAGQTRTIEFTLDLTQLAFYDPDMRFVIEPGDLEIMVGASSSDIRASTRIAITGETREVARADVRPTTVRVT